jgi:hypothetical protein
MHPVWDCRNTELEHVRAELRRMTPIIPKNTSAGQNMIESFGGILTTEFLTPAPG